MIGFKNSCFPIILLTSCYQTVCYRTVQEANHIQSCSLNQLNQFFFSGLIFNYSFHQCPWLRGSLKFVSSVQIYEFHISKIIIHHLDDIFGPNILISSQLACQLSWWSAAPVSQRSRVQIPYGPEFFFSGPIFNYSFQQCSQLRGSLKFVSSPQIYEFRISKIIIHHLDSIFGPNISTSSLLDCQLSWQSAVPVSQRFWVQIPYGPGFFFFTGPIFNYSFQQCSQL